MFRLNLNNFRNTITLIGLIIGITLFILFDPEQREELEMKGKSYILNKEKGTGFIKKLDSYMTKYYRPQEFTDGLAKYSCKLDLYQNIKSNFTSSCKDRNLLPRCTSKPSQQECYGRLEQDDGNYLGEIDNGNPEGMGVFTWNDGSSRIGFHINGAINYGYDKDVSGRITYIGEYSNDLYDGEGTEIYHEPLHVYFGMMKEGLRDGKGIYISKEYIYEGDFKYGHEHGTGEYVGENMIYKGFFKYAQFNGPDGIWRDAQGSNYYGEFKNGLSHGYGVQNFSSGDRYAGFWAHDTRHGKGEYTFKDGTTFIGNYNYGHLDDNAAVIKNNDYTCISVYKNDRKNGLEECIYNDGTVTKINYKNGINHGQSYELNSEGVKIYTNYVEGVENGEYKRIFPDGVSETHSVVDDVPMGKLNIYVDGINTRTCDYDYGIEKNCIEK